MNLLISNKTFNEIEMFIKNPSQVLLIIGSEGSGKQYLTDSIIDRIIDSDNLGAKARSLIDINKAKQPITIDEVRSIKHQLMLISGENIEKRIIAIRNIENMNEQAQNALLKQLEDTPKNTIFIINTSRSNRVLDTIKSRSLTIKVINPNLNEYKKYYDVANIDSFFVMSDGRSRFMSELVNGEASEFLATVGVAKKYATNDSYNRLLMTDDLLKNYDIDLFIFCLIQIYRSLLISSADKQKSQKYNENLKVIADSQEFLLVSNPNLKLMMTNLAVSL